MKFLKLGTLGLMLMGASQVSLAGECGPDTLSLRGSFNGWGNTPMMCEGGLFKVQQTLSTFDSFKFDVHGDWSDNYGDVSPTDGTLDFFGPDIRSVGEGEFEIAVDFNAKTYTVEPVSNADVGIDNVDISVFSPGGCFGCVQKTYDVTVNVEEHGVAQVSAVLEYWSNDVKQSDKTPAVTLESQSEGQEVWTFFLGEAAWDAWEKLTITMTYGEQTFTEVYDFRQACESTMFLRGTFNNWGSHEMACHPDGFWITTVSMEEGGRFKFDRHGDWSDNYGDNDPSSSVAGTVEQTGNDIFVNFTGDMRVSLKPNNDYFIAQVPTVLCENHMIAFGEPINDHNALRCSAEDTWTGQMSLADMQDSLRGGIFIVYPEAGVPIEGTVWYGDNEQDGIADSVRFGGGGSTDPINKIDLPTVDGDYLITFNEETKAYSFELIGGTDDVTISFKRKVVENGELVTVPFGSGYAVYFDDMHPSCGGCGGPAGIVGEDSTFTTSELEAGEHTVLLYKAGSTSTTIISSTASFTVEGDSVEVIFEPVSVTVSTQYSTVMGEALYITGQTDYLGNWGTAYKMSYVAERNRWEYTGPMPQNVEYKLIKANWVNEDSISTSASSVAWQQGENNKLSENILLNTFRSVTISPNF